MSYREFSGKLAVLHSRKLARMSTLTIRKIGQGDFTAALAGALRHITAGARSSAKLLAEAANSNVRTAENWLAARAIPNTYHWECLCEAFPELRSEIDRLRGAEQEGEPIERQITMLINQAVRLKAAHDQTLARQNGGAETKAPQRSGEMARHESSKVGD